MNSFGMGLGLDGDISPIIRLTSDQSGGLDQVDLKINMNGAHTVTIDWGDGNTSAVSGEGSTYSSTYAATESFTIQVYGRIDQMTKFYASAGQATISGNIATFKPCNALTYLDLSYTGVDGDIADLPSGLTGDLNLYDTSVSGDIADLPSGLTGDLYLSDTSVSGDIADLPSGLTGDLYLGSTGVSGDIADLPSGLTGNLYLSYIGVDGDIADLPSGLTGGLYLSYTGVDGDIADLPSGLTGYLYLDNTDISAYTADSWPCNTANGKTIDLDDLDLTQGECDNILCHLDTKGITGGTLDLTGNSIPSATGLACKDNLEGKGWTVSVDS